jgi:hypothetical protein
VLTLYRHQLRSRVREIGVSITTVDVRTGDETLVALLLTPPFQVFLRVLTVVHACGIWRWLTAGWRQLALIVLAPV